MAAGFAQGAYDVASNQYIVRQRDAHAWPEVYFEGYGWIEFEPTVSQPVRVIPAGGDGLEPGSDEGLLGGAVPTIDPNDRFSDLENIDVPGSAAARRAITGRVLIAAILIGIAALVFLGWRMAKKRMKLPVFPVFLEHSLAQRGLNPPAWLRTWVTRINLSPIEKAYNHLNQALRRLGQPAPPWATPGERGLAVAELLPAAEPYAEFLVAEYEHEIYGSKIGDSRRAQEAGKAIRNLSWQAFFKRLLREESRSGRGVAPRIVS